HVGSYDSPEAWARAVGEDLQWEAHLDQVVDPMLRPHVAIDYAHVAREARQSWMSWRGTTAAPMCSCDNHPSGHLPGGLWLPTFTRPAPRGAGERPHHTEEGTISHD
ncbi:MAG: hypothetical protein ACRDRL_28490, partial [Sciscionella sp.]